MDRKAIFITLLVGVVIFLIGFPMLLEWQIPQYNLIVAALFSILMYGVYRFIEFFPKLMLKATSFFENPKPQNLFIYPSWFLLDNILTLKLMSIEWRYPLRKTTAFVTIPPLNENFYSPHPEDKFEWRNQKALILELKRFFVYDIKFLEVDPKKNVFWIRTVRNKNIGFSPDKYGFEVHARLNVYPSDNITANSADKTIYLIVEYKGGKKISVKKTNKREYQKYIWNRKSVNEKRVGLTDGNEN